LFKEKYKIVNSKQTLLVRKRNKQIESLMTKCLLKFIPQHNIQRTYDLIRKAM